MSKFVHDHQQAEHQNKRNNCCHQLNSPRVPIMLGLSIQQKPEGNFNFPQAYESFSLVEQTNQVHQWQNNQH